MSSPHTNCSKALPVSLKKYIVPYSIFPNKYAYYCIMFLSISTTILMTLHILLTINEEITYNKVIPSILLSCAVTTMVISVFGFLYFINIKCTNKRDVDTNHTSLLFDPSMYIHGSIESTSDTTPDTISDFGSDDVADSLL